MNSGKEVMTKVINGHMYEIAKDKDDANKVLGVPVALSMDAVNAAKSDPEHYLNKTLELDPKTLEPIVKDESEKESESAYDKLRRLKGDIDAGDDSGAGSGIGVSNDSPDFV